MRKVSPPQVMDADDEKAMSVWRVFCQLEEKDQAEIWDWMMSQPVGKDSGGAITV
jgi:hypothetical protein